jgi:hypothetical protein
MGTINSKSSNNIIHSKNYNRFSSFSRPPSYLSSYTHQNGSNDINLFNNRRRSCLKKKVLILGLDGVGKTDLFGRIISYYKQGYKIDLLPRPTIGKFV